MAYTLDCRLLDPVTRDNVGEKLPSLGSGFRWNDGLDATYLICLIPDTMN